MPDLPPIEWRVHLASSPEETFKTWATDSGREQFWAEHSIASNSGFSLHFIGGEHLDVSVLESEPPKRFVFRYFGESLVSVAFEGDGKGGCDVLLREEGVPEPEYLQNHAGWVSVLLSLKAALDFDVDLRGHDPARSWAQRYVEN